MRVGHLAAISCLAGLAGCGLFGGSSPKPSPLTEFAAQVKPVAAWTVSVGKSGGYRLWPTVSGGRVHAAAADGTITVLDEETGRVISRFELNRKLSSGASGDGEILFAGTIKGDIVAFDASGKEKWKANVAGEVLAPVTVAGKNAIVRTADGRIYALDLADGKRRWVYQRAAPALLLRGESGVVATPTNVVAGYPGGKLIALDLDDGKLTWEVTVSLPRGATELERVADVSGIPVIDSGRICAAAYQGKVACFDIQGGNTLWTRELSSATGLALDDRSVYISDDQDNVHALDREGGASRWKQDKLLRRRLTAPVASGGRVVVGDAFGYLHILSRDDGAIIGRHAIDGTEVNALLAVKGGVLAQTAGGSLTLVRF
jgi:outer membrane protein assembly factor BamB